MIDKLPNVLCGETAAAFFQTQNAERADFKFLRVGGVRRGGQFPAEGLFHNRLKSSATADSGGFNIQEKLIW